MSFENLGMLEPVTPTLPAPVSDAIATTMFNARLLPPPAMDFGDGSDIIDVASEIPFSDKSSLPRRVLPPMSALSNPGESSTLQRTFPSAGTGDDLPFGGSISRSQRRSSHQHQQLPHRSGRQSAEPFSHPTFPRWPAAALTPKKAELDALDLGPIDLRNIDPVTAQKMLDDIRSGADIKPLLDKLRSSNSKPKPPPPPKRSVTASSSSEHHTKVVTFEDEMEAEEGNAAKRKAKMKASLTTPPGDVFM